MNDIVKRQIEILVETLNKASDAYYNSGEPIMGDVEFDRKLNRLKELEQQTGYVLPNSPTKNVGAKVLTALKEVTLETPMLSLDKCHSVEEIVKFKNKKPIVGMLKLDGLSVLLGYKDGKLAFARTRGDGVVGNDITEHVKQFTNVPKYISTMGDVKLKGEAIIKYSDFAIVNKDGQFKNPRNTASGTLAQLDTSVVKDRRMSLVVWEVVSGYPQKTHVDRLDAAKKDGFEVVPYYCCFNNDVDMIEGALKLPEWHSDYPCDGIVFKFNDLEYGKTLGRTEKFFRDGIAYKYENKDKATTLRRITWNTTKTGTINPVAEFDPVELYGTTVTKATLHNLKYMNDIGIKIGATVYVTKANEIIPRVTGCDSVEADYEIPSKCPCCGGRTYVQNNFLYCENPDCDAKILSKLENFVSKKGMDIRGISAEVIDFLYNKGWVKSYVDLYHLSDSAKLLLEWKNTEGYGSKSVNKLLQAIEDSRKVELHKFLAAQSIPLLGTTASKQIAEYCDNNVGEFIEIMDANPCMFSQNIIGIGNALVHSLSDYWVHNADAFEDLANEMEFIMPAVKQPTSGADLTGKTFVVTGSVHHFKNRAELSEKIETLGGKVAGSVSKNTSYLINNDTESSSGKNKKAKELNIPIISEDDFLKMIN